ncbi:cupin domain-containing protein [Mycobacterium deserti]|uniref:Cupin domain-containing protein n=1 Tax=Mycobacterium deserti TaxID=2978347 RepID=A0ABT2M6W5_9MYCO|nr:cupin domain-containing protein [Mycobacterium deserti]MCT7658008.1 cupin domain-containing protein [Mycobacterium deserti]
MEFIRPFDPTKNFDTGFPGYEAQFLAHLEDAVMIASHIKAGGCGPHLHYHRSDQVYCLMRGGMTVRLGNEVHVIDAPTLVFIPAGLPHCNWNATTDLETHFEMIVPAPLPTDQIVFFVDSMDSVPAEDRAKCAGYVRPVDQSATTEPMPGFRTQALADRSTGSTNAVVYYAEVDPGNGGPDCHIHEFDQYYLVLEGQLTVEVALETHVVGPDTLVVLPAGVPHRQYNAGDTTEKHIAVLTPAPAEGRPWDRGVAFAANGVDEVGVIAPAGKV